MKAELLLICIILVFTQCGIFSPRDEFEEPDSSTLVDPFNFDGILSGTGEHFLSTDLDELFDMGMVYIDANTGTNTHFYKTEFSNNLQYLKQMYEITVNWGDTSTIEDGSSPPVQVKYVDDSLIINQIEYRVEYKKKNTENPTTESQVGSCNFILVGKGAWKIHSWTDIPYRKEGKVGEQSFFVPVGSDK